MKLNFIHPFHFCSLFQTVCKTDPNRNGGGVLVSINENIPSKESKECPIQNCMDGTFVEMNFQKCRWLLFGSYNRPFQSHKHFLDYLSFRLDVLTKNRKMFCVKLCKKEMKKYCNDINVKYKSNYKSIICLRVKIF